MHLYELGYRRVPELATKKFQRPYRGDQGTFNPAASGCHCPLQTLSLSGSRTSISSLPTRTRAMLQQYRDAGMIPEAPPADNSPRSWRSSDDHRERVEPVR